MPRNRPIPTREQSIEGVALAIVNADKHVGAADALAAAALHGFAVAHLVLAIEECEKGRVLGKVALGESVPKEEVRGAMYDHKARHPGALAKSWSSGGVIIDYLGETTRERVGLLPPRSSEQRWADVDARHPEVLPRNWPDIASDLREGGLYVNLAADGWHTPHEITAEAFAKLRISAVHLLHYLDAVYDREIAPLLAPSPPA